jgi:hypothetical protein
MKNDIQKQPGSVWKLVVKSEESLIYEGPLDTFLQKENLKDLEAVIQYCEESDFTATVTNTIKARPTEEELMEMERQPPVATIVCPTPFTKGGIDGSGILKMESNCWEESSP